jgi:serine/threonine protein kinase
MSPSTKVIDDPSDPLIGQTLGGNYTISRIIGRGGVGLVYLAHRRDGDRDAVVKVLAPQWAADAEALARFEREARRLNGLRHPNIVSMYDFGRHNRTAYLAMEYLQGELLSAYVDRNGRLTLAQFVPIAAQILKGIGHAHSREMMVRDIKPANVMLCHRKGRANFVKILDFGLAKLVKGDSPITEEHVMGTVGYLSPEQIRGDALDLRVDVYALGIMFYYMLAGRTPFAGEDNAAIFYKTVNEPAPDLAKVAPDGDRLPAGLVALIHRCLAKDRDQRPADADEIVEGLIDVVPAAMFRLPRAETVHPGVPGTSSFGNTGMLELLGKEPPPPSARAGARATDVRDLVPITAPLPTADTTPSPAEHDPDIDDLGEDADVPAGRNMFGALAIGVLLAAVGGGLAAYVFRGQTQEQPARAPAPTSEHVAGAAGETSELSDRLGAVETALAAGRLDEAAATLDEIRDAAQADATLAPRFDRAQRTLRVARLMAVATGLEADGRPQAALDAYREVVEADETHVAARAAIARLSEDEEKPVAPPATAVQATTVPRTPPAKGTTDGRQVGRRGHGGRPTPSPATPAPATTPTPAPEPPSKPDPDLGPPTPAAKKDSPFLPTKKDGKSPVFLPTKKKSE